MSTSSPNCLVLGLGAVGTYIGAHIAATGIPVTFLVRPGKTDVATENGIQATSPDGSFEAANVRFTDRVDSTYDLVVLSCKTYQLDSAINSVRPAVGKNSIVLPFLNGTTHIALLDQAFSREQVWGGVAHFSVIKRSPTHVERLSPNDILITGPRGGAGSDLVQKLFDHLANRGMTARVSNQITYDMWEKWVFIVTLAGMTSLMRGAVGEIASQSGGPELAKAMFAEAGFVASAVGYEPNPEFIEQSITLLTNEASSYKASLLRDIEQGNRTEVEGLMADFVGIAKSQTIDCPLLELATLHIKVYEARATSAR